MAKVIIPVGLDVKDVKKNTKSVKDMLKSLGGTSKETGNQLEQAFSKGNAKAAKLITDLQKANTEVKKQTDIVADLKTRLDELQTGKATVKTTEITSLTKELNDTEKAADKVAQKMDKIGAEAERIRQSSITIDGVTAVSDPQKYAELTSELDRLGVEYQSLSDKANATKIKLQEATGKATQAEISKTNTKLQETSAKLDSAKAKATKAGEALKKSASGGTLGIEKFNSRIAGLAKRVFVFSIITKALRALRNLFAQSAQGSDQFKGAIASLQQNLWAIYSVLYQYVMPVIIKVTQLISQLAQNILTLLSKMLGKSTSQLLANGNALKKQTQGLEKTGKAAKKAKGQLAAFDEVNQISKDSGENSGEDTAGATGGLSFDASAISQNVQNVLDAILLVAGGAMFVIGLLLTCTGHFGIGIGLMLAGIAVLAAQIVSIDWNDLPKNIRDTITEIAAIAGGALLALGIILTCVHVSPLSIGLIVAGAASLAGAVALNWNFIVEQLRGTVGKIMAIVGGALLVLGIVLVCCGIIPLGVGLIIAGAVALVTVIAVNWDSLKNKIKTVISAIMAIAGGALVVLGLICCLTGGGLPIGVALIIAGMKTIKKADQLSSNPVTRFFKNMANGIIDIFEKAVNFIVKMLNKLSWDVPDWVPLIGGKKFGFNLKYAKIPRLAKGGVIYQPTVAQIGEYSGARNNPEIVSPENKLREIYAEGNAETNSLLQQLIQVMQKGMTVNVDGKQLMRINREAETRVGRQTVTGGFANAY
nr:MAG TPA: minor tail protein [Caudoviricetes sp.]